MKSILINPDTCTKCGTCMEICPVNLIVPDSEGMPFMPDEVGVFCTKCGNCEAFCPEDSISPEFNTTHSAISEEEMHGITPGQIGVYMRQRRSVRNYTDEIVKREKIEEILKKVKDN